MQSVPLRRLSGARSDPMTYTCTAKDPLLRQAQKSIIREELQHTLQISKGKNAKYTVYPGSSDPPEKILNIFASENEVYTIF